MATLIATHLKMPQTVSPAAGGRPLSRGRATLRRRLEFIAGCAVFLLAFHYFYKAVVAPVYFNFGYPYFDAPSRWWHIFLVYAILPSLWLPLSITRPTQYLYFFIYLTVYLPICCLLPSVAPSYPMDFASALYFASVLLVCFAGLGIVYRIPTIRLRLPVLSTGPFLALVFLLCMLCFAVLVLHYGSSMSLVSLFAPHEHRIHARGILASSSIPFLGYFLVIPSRALHPLLIAFGWWFRKWWLVALALFGEAVVYSCAAQREGVFWVAVIVPLVLVAFRSHRRFFACLVWTVSIFFLLTIVAVSTSPSGEIGFVSRLTAMRVFVSPGKLTIDYFQFFQHGPYTYFSHITGLGWLHENYFSDTTIGLVVGEHISGDFENNANGNLWADGLASLGFIGMLIVTVIAGILFYVTDSALRHVSVVPTTISLSRLGIALSNCSIFTVFLGGGFLVALIVNAVAPWNAPAQSRERHAQSRASPSRHRT